jgi:hypothetical protein
VGILLRSAIFRLHTPVAVRLSTGYAQNLWPTAFYALETDSASGGVQARAKPTDVFFSHDILLRENIFGAINGKWLTL